MLSRNPNPMDIKPARTMTFRREDLYSIVQTNRKIDIYDRSKGDSISILEVKESWKRRHQWRRKKTGRKDESRNDAMGHDWIVVNRYYYWLAKWWSLAHSNTGKQSGSCSWSRGSMKSVVQWRKYVHLRMVGVDVWGNCRCRSIGKAEWGGLL